MTARTLVAGSAVRLSFDTGPKSVGYVVDVVDKVRVRVEFPSDTGSHEGTFLDGRASRFMMPRHVVVPVCEWVETYPDDFGMACSEPGVPTSYDIPCRFDATTSVDLVDIDGDPTPMNLCDEHHREAHELHILHSAQQPTG